MTQVLTSHHEPKGSRIIFLDIDGPMIPARSYIWNRHAALDQEIDTMCAKVLRAIVDATGAQIVFNSTHSGQIHPFNDGSGDYPGLLKRFEAFGFHRGGDVHEDCRTVYSSLPRMEAIEEWLSRHPEVDEWIALDDALIDHERAFPVNNHHGIGFYEYQHARKWFLKETPKVILM